MSGIFNKYRKAYSVMAFVVFGLGSALAFYDYKEGKGRVHLIAGIVFLILTVFKGEEMYSVKKNSKIEKDLK